MGTAKIAELLSNPPSVSERMVVGSKVARETSSDDDDDALSNPVENGVDGAVVRKSVGATTALSEDDEVAYLVESVLDGEKAKADEMAKQKNRRDLSDCIM